MCDAFEKFCIHLLAKNLKKALKNGIYGNTLKITENSRQITKNWTVSNRK